LERTPRSRVLDVPSRTITQIAAEVGVSSDTLRYYEKAGLITPAGRTEAGYRLYGDETADRLRLIKGAQRSGLRLREIRELLEVKDHGGCPCGHTEALLARRVSDVDAEIRQLRELRHRLVELLAVACTCTDAGVWSCEVELIRRGGET
jgi:DNA-binding transcriptional MerR regulator